MDGRTPSSREYSPSLRGKFIREVNQPSFIQHGDQYRHPFHGQSPDSFWRYQSGNQPPQTPGTYTRGTAPPRCSYIFISSLRLPVHITIRPHLEATLWQYGCRKVCHDDKGWYIDFGVESSDEARLWRCYNDLNRTQLFSQYVLEMELRSDEFPSSLQDGRQATPTCSTGRTYSDSSPNRHVRCHRCKAQPSQVEPLMHCSTCPRCYHQKCHGDFSQVGQAGRSWQCGKCVAKHARLEGHIAEDSSLFAMQEPARKRRKRDSDTIEVARPRSSVQRTPERYSGRPKEIMRSVLQQLSSVRSSRHLALEGSTSAQSKSTAASIEPAGQPKLSLPPINVLSDVSGPPHKEYESPLLQLEQPLVKTGQAVDNASSHNTEPGASRTDVAADPLQSIATHATVKPAVLKLGKRTPNILTVKCDQCLRYHPFRPGAGKQLCRTCRHAQKANPAEVPQVAITEQETAVAPVITEIHDSPSIDTAPHEGEAQADVTHCNNPNVNGDATADGLSDDASSHASEHDETSNRIQETKATQKEVFKRRGKYLTLIGMAFAAHASKPLRSKDITAWIIANTNELDMNEDRWRSRISAILSQNRGKGHDLWEYVQAHGGDKSGTYRLLPGSKEKLAQLGTHSYTLPQQSPIEKHPQGHTPITTREPSISPARKRNKATRSTQTPPLSDVQMVNELPITADTERVTTPSKAEIDKTMELGSGEVHTEVLTAVDHSTDDQLHSGDVRNTSPSSAALHTSRDPSYFSSEQYKLDEANFSNRSPGNWPDMHHDCRSFNKQEKLREIAMRPTRKQAFGKPASFSRIGVVPILQPLAMQHSHDDDTSLLAENEISGFGLPEVPMAVIHGGQLAFRDGTLNKDGVLPRAKALLRPTLSRYG
ncbi:hypothetical protein K431DRAFT_284828 [Polychaeton citri CBS 116435]|uniref:PHD-type domain-containing protein n=1 Tax=Polychaeton citri CBS 116435 TaxID=1314669 RepID=A0A9P4UMN7_9PEZI|nr:hypothetical protein K431DRAFT_284828 [Polychaeton citri CBS 116435]